MSVKMSKGKEILFALTCFLSSFTIMWQMYEIVITNELYIVFPDHGGIITAILSWPSLLTAAASFVSGSLLKKVSTKLELTAAAVLMLAGLLPLFSGNIYVLLLASILMAVAAGISNTAGMAIISEVYIDDTKRSKMMGWYNSAMSLLSCGITLIGGMLAINGWQTGFHIYWFVIPMLLMTILFLPDIKPADQAQEDSAQESAEGTSHKGLGGRFWSFYTSAFIFFIPYSFFFTFISMYIMEHNLGDAGFIGIVSTCTTVGSLVAGLVFGYIFSKMHRTFNVACYIIPILVFALMYFAPSRPVVISGALLYGFCYGSVFTFIYAYPGYCVPMEKMGFVMGLMTMNYSVAIFVGVYIATWVMGAVGGSITASYPYAILIMAVTTVLEIICCVKDKKDGIEY